MLAGSQQGKAANCRRRLCPHRAECGGGVAVLGRTAHLFQAGRKFALALRLAKAKQATILGVSG